MLITETFQDVPTKADGNGNIRIVKLLYSNLTSPLASSRIIYIHNYITNRGGRHGRGFFLFFTFLKKEKMLILISFSPSY